jgi:hypothetical protein
MKFKHDFDKERFEDLCEPLKYLAHEMDFFFTVNGHEMVVTSTWSTPEENAKLNRKEIQHVERRAIDIRSIGLPEKFKKEFMTRFSTLYKGWGAISRSSGQEALIVHHTGTAEHFHVQLKRDHAKIKIPKEGMNGKATTIH